MYAVGHRNLRREAHWYAAVRACGPGAALSHWSAAGLWELRAAGGAALVDVTVPSRNGRRRRRGIRIHRASRLPREETLVRDGIPVTSVARTLLDLADVLSRQQLERAVTQAEFRGRFDLRAINAVVASNPGRRGALLLAAAGAPPALTEPGLEDRFMAFVLRHGLPRLRVNVWIEGEQVDFHWPAAELIVETDGGAAHRTRRAFVRDRQRDRKLLLATGNRTIRLTETDFFDEVGLARDLARLLRADVEEDPAA